MSRRQPPKSKPEMSVIEAGRKGGITTRRRYGIEFYERIGRKGGQRVKALIEEGKRLERQGS